MRLVEFGARLALASIVLVASITPAFADDPGGAAAAPTIPAPAQGAVAAPTGPQPKASIAEVTFNAGDVPKGDVISHDFVVKNGGTADLMILNVKPQCGCTVPDWTKIVPPGGTGKISLKVDTATFKGPISKTATVQTSDPELASLRLTVNANVTTYVDVLPSDTVTFRLYRGEDKKQVVTIHSNEAAELKISDVKVSGDGIKYALAKSSEGTNDHELTLWMDPSTPIGAVNGSVTLKTSSPKKPEVLVNVRGQVLGQITVSPGTLFFRIDQAPGAAHWSPTTDNLNLRERGEIGAPVVVKLARDAKLTLVDQVGDWAKVRTEGGEEGWAARKFLAEQAPAAVAGAAQSKVLNLTHRLENAGFSVTGATVEGKFDAKSVKVATEAVKEGQSYRLTVTYGGGLPQGNYTGTLVVKTTDKDEPEVRVPLYIVVA